MKRFKDRDMTWVMRKLHKVFRDEDRADPFYDREYVAECNRIFNFLKNSNGISDMTSSTDRAMYDIVLDIFSIHKAQWRRRWLK
jgi:hypothetical protein